MDADEAAVLGASRTGRGGGGASGAEPGACARPRGPRGLVVRPRCSSVVEVLALGRRRGEQRHRSAVGVRDLLVEQRRTPRGSARRRGRARRAAPRPALVLLEQRARTSASAPR